jgi:hypothetical protein
MNRTTRTLSSRGAGHFPAVCMSLVVLLVTGCTSNAPAAPSLSAPATLPPSWTATVVPPSATPKPTQTPTKQPTPTPACDLNTTLAAAKDAVPYDEYAVHANVISGISTLAVWFVDPNLNPSAAGDQIGDTMDQAKLDAVDVIHRVAHSSACAGRLFDEINAIVVDRTYVGWLSGQLSPRSLPDPTELSPSDASTLAEQLYLAFERTAPADPYRKGTCSWPATRDRLQAHFSPERENVAFYFVVDDLGPNIWVQWDGPSDPLMLTLNVGNIMLESDCFPPEGNIIFIIVDDVGNTELVGLIPRMNMDGLQILYSR